MANKANTFAKCETITEVLGQLAGSASLCWVSGETPFESPTFDSDEAGALTKQAEDRIKELIVTAAFR